MSLRLIGLLYIQCLLIAANHCQGFVVQSNEATTAVNRFRRMVGSSEGTRSHDGCFGRHAEKKQQNEIVRWRRSSRRQVSVHASRAGIWATCTSTSLLAAKDILPLTYMVLLAFQFAVQPILTQKFAPKTMIRSTYVLMQDWTRIVIAALLLTTTGSWGSAFSDWSWQASLLSAGIPSTLYLVQNFCSLIAYQNLQPITYNVLNQTKTLSAAFWCFFLLNQRQSFQQILALGILLLSALVMENVVHIPFCAPTNESSVAESSESDNGESDNRSDSIRAGTCQSKSTERRAYIFTGVLPVLAASLISGLAGAWIQRSLQSVKGGNSLFLTLQMSVFSSMFLTASLLTISPDRQRAIDTGSWTTGWTLGTWIPIFVNALGGVLVGLVTKFSGAVSKGFALIAGMFLSGILQNYLSSGDGTRRVSTQQWIGGALAALSVYIHSTSLAVH